VFGDPVKYANRFVRCSQASPSERAAADACLNFPNFDPIAYIDVPSENLGNISTYGVDVSFATRFPTGEYGRLSINMDGTYVTKYDYQREEGGEYIHNVGVYADASPIFRWQHNLAFNWSLASWSVTLVNLYRSGYLDQTPPHTVASYSIYDLSVAWTGVKNLTLLAGVHNIMDTDPPRSNQVTTFQRGYDPRFTDPRGRTWIFRVAYKFI
jgi:iron complex outermembrane receptor protein